MQQNQHFQAELFKKLFEKKDYLDSMSNHADYKTDTMCYHYILMIMHIFQYHQWIIQHQHYSNNGW